MRQPRERAVRSVGHPDYRRCPSFEKAFDLDAFPRPGRHDHTGVLEEIAAIVEQLSSLDGAGGNAPAAKQQFRRNAGEQRRPHAGEHDVLRFADHLRGGIQVGGACARLVVEDAPQVGGLRLNIQ